MNNGRRIEQIKNNEVVYTYESVTQVCNTVGIAPNAIFDMLKGRRKSPYKGEYYFRYEDADCASKKKLRQIDSALSSLSSEIERLRKMISDELVS